MSNNLWMRKLRITLTSKLIKTGDNSLVFGDEGINGYNDSLSIKVSGTKYPSTLKDKGTVVITNLDYATIAKIMLYKYYIIKIEAGYKDNNFVTIFEGEVSYISQKIHSHHDCDCYITYASKLVAAYSQSRINFTMRSGINAYALLTYIGKMAGFNTNGLSQSLKAEVINEMVNENATASSIIDNIVNNTTGEYVISTDGENGSVIDITKVLDKRKIKIDNDSIPVGSGNPTLSSDGISLQLLPVFNFRVGDIIVIDNSILDMSISNAESVTNTFNSNYIDSKGEYIIYQIDYSFENRGTAFGLSIKARALDVISGLIGART